MYLLKEKHRKYMACMRKQELGILQLYTITIKFIYICSLNKLQNRVSVCIIAAVYFSVHCNRIVRFLQGAPLRFIKFHFTTFCRYDVHYSEILLNFRIVAFFLKERKTTNIFAIVAVIYCCIERIVLVWRLAFCHIECCLNFFYVLCEYVGLCHFDDHKYFFLIQSARSQN